MALLFVGYQKACLREIERVARESSNLVDIARYGPKVGAGDLASLVAFCRLNPLSTESKVRTVIIDGRQLQRRVQSFLLKLIEEPPPTCQVIILSDTENQLLPTILSRCDIVNYPTPSFGDLIKDLSSLDGMSFEAAAETAKWMARGLDSDAIPDAAAFTLAQNLLLYAKNSELEQAISVCFDFDERAAVALRYELIEERDVKSLVRSMVPSDPKNIGIMVLRERIQGSR